MFSRAHLRCGLAASVAFAASIAFAQLENPTVDSIVGARNLSLSPDGSRLAFTYQGDVWVVDAKGGRAIPVTNHVEMDDRAVWSPDGKWIAFASNRTGNWDIFVVPAAGGTPRRLTWHSGGDIPTDWTPDGKEILFSGKRDDQYNALYAIDVKTGQIRPLYTDYQAIGEPAISPDGKRVFFTRSGFPWFRARYQGSAASQLWMLDTTNGKAKALRNTEQQHLWPKAMPDGNGVVVTVSDKTPSSRKLNETPTKFVDSANRTPNVYAVNANGGSNRITDFVGGGVRFLTTAKESGLMAFEYEGDIYTMRRGEKPTKVSVVATTDDKTGFEERIVLTDGVSSATLDAKAENVVFQVRGEIWSVPVKKGKGPNKDDATQLTTWEGMDSEPVYAPDGKSFFYTSDMDGAQRLYQMDLATKKATPISPFGADVQGLQLSGDRKSLNFWITGGQGGLYAVPVTGGAPKLLIANNEGGSAGFSNYSWSPDNRYIAYSKNTMGTLINAEQPTNIYIFDTTTGKETNVTQLAAVHEDPAWSSDGKYLYFRSNRDGGDAMFVLPLQQEGTRSNELDLKFTKPTEAVKVEIDFDDIAERIRRFGSTPPSGSIVTNPESGDVYFASAGDIWRMNYAGEEARKLTNGGGIGGFEFSDDKSKLFYIQNGNVTIMDLKRPGNPAEVVAFRADWSRDLRKERGAAFAQFWRMFNRNFYDSNFHGRDWTAIRKRYEPLLSSVGHRNEFANVLNMMVGELESSHSEVGPAPGNPSGNSSAHPGFVFDYSYRGPGLKVKEVPKGAPGSFSQTRLAAGEYVLAINGKDVRADEALWRDVLSNQAGREITLTVSKSPDKTGAREVKYRALSSGEFNGIYTQNRVKDLRKYIEQKSNGQLTYIWIPGMNQGALNIVRRQAFEYAQGKKGLIIDVRGNGGGNTADAIVDMLEREPHAFYQARDGKAGFAPSNAWNLPVVVLHGENSFSNAEMFPYAMKQRKLATLVGKQTPGYVIWTWGLPLVDGTSARMPGAGTYRMDGTPQENMGQKPDIEIDFSNEDYQAGKDPQVDKAIEVLLSKIK